MIDLSRRNRQKKKKKKDKATSELHYLIRLKASPLIPECNASPERKKLYERSGILAVLVVVFSLVFSLRLRSSLLRNVAMLID